MKEAKSKKNIPRANRIYVNRSLNMGKIKSIGFDMDHTLAIYNREEFEALAFRATLEKFISAGYPEELSKLKFKSDFLVRGLLVDRERGNILKVDGHKYVKTAYHGHQPLSKTERHLLYNSHGFKADKFLSVDTFFSLSEVQLFVEIVDYMKRFPGKIEKTFTEVYSDLRKFIDDSHRDGSIKDRVLSDPEKYFKKDKNLAKTLTRYINSGKSLFLLTNSHWEYTSEIMSFLLDGVSEDFVQWRDFFDFSIVGANKPDFFTGKQPFFQVMTDTGLLKIHRGPLEKKDVYHGGNAKLFQELTGVRGDEVMYVGDHVFGDIIRSKHSLNWRTLLIIEELEAEIKTLDNLQPTIEDILADISAKEDLEESIHRLQAIITANTRRAEKASKMDDLKKSHYLNVENEKLIEQQHAESELLTEANKAIKEKIWNRQSQVHPVWGELMKVGLEQSRFANQIVDYACIYTTKVSNMRLYSSFKNFISFHDTLPHEAL